MKSRERFATGFEPMDESTTFLKLANEILNCDQQIFLAYDAQQAVQLMQHLGGAVALVDLDLNGNDGLWLMQKTGVDVFVDVFMDGPLRNSIHVMRPTTIQLPAAPSDFCLLSPISCRDIKGEGLAYLGKAKLNTAPGPETAIYCLPSNE